MSVGTVTAAVVQAHRAPDLEAGLDLTAERTAAAAGRGARLVVFPETWLPGYPTWIDYCGEAGLWDHEPTKAVYARLAAESVAVPGPALERLAEMARSNAVTLVVGISERVDRGPGRGTLYNALLTLGPDGSLLNHHRKLTPTHTERLVWGPGDSAGLVAVDTPVGRVGGLICWEHWSPLTRQAMHESGEDIHIAAWSAVVGVNDMHQHASRCYAFEARCYVLAAGALMRAGDLPPDLEPHPAKIRSPDQWLLRGGSAIIGPDGGYLAGPVHEEEATLIAELDLERNRVESMTLDVTGHYHRPELFTFEVRRTERPLPGGHRPGGSDGSPGEERS